MFVLSVALLFCLTVGNERVKTAASVEMPFAVEGRVGPTYHALDVDQLPYTGMGNFLCGRLIRCNVRRIRYARRDLFSN